MIEQGDVRELRGVFQRQVSSVASSLRLHGGLLAAAPRVNNSGPAQSSLVALIAALGFLAALMFGGCRGQRESHREVWAEVNGHPIYRDEVERYYRRRLAGGQEAPSTAQELSL